jgi:hypothetical protein
MVATFFYVKKESALKIGRETHPAATNGPLCQGYFKRL